ncbi:MAG: response regulator [Sulfuricellaceae bacterium]
MRNELKMDAQDETRIILLVEDDPGDQELTRRALADCKRHIRLQVVNDGDEALDYLYRRNAYADTERYPLPDLILLDLNLIRLNGIQVLEQVRNDLRLQHIPVIMLTTSQQERDVTRAYNSGACSYVVKPSGIEQFTKILRIIEEYWFNTVRLPSRR